MREIIDNLLALWAEAFELVIYVLDRTWVGSIVEAVVGKAQIISAFFAVLRYVRALQLNRIAQRQAGME